MQLLIRIKNNKPFEHPILLNNFIAAFPDVDINNLPEWVARFERVEIPNLEIDEIYEGTTYEWVDGIIKDVHHIRKLTEEEKQNIQNNTISFGELDLVGGSKEPK